MNNTQLKLEEINTDKTICCVGIVNKSNVTFNDLPPWSLEEELAQSTGTMFFEHVTPANFTSGSYEV